MPFSIMTLVVMTFSIMSFSIMTLRMITFSIMTLSIITLNIKGLVSSLSINNVVLCLMLHFNSVLWPSN
jgi:hypothetical protein